MSDIEEPRPGLTGEARIEVGPADTARALGSGDVPVLGTPRVLALAEEATVAALAGRLEPGRTTVGTSVGLRHLAASPVGARVRVRAELREADGRRLVFAVEAVQEAASGGGRVVADGTVERVVVDRERFIASAAG
ncbi:thioesterase [Nocardiopsis sp. CNT-189]|uniref:thioesterase family protein n=1 Tax=Nocardiopsis oceanisediminis TaxID=2816862 RepID=UPI003B2C8741